HTVTTAVDITGGAHVRWVDEAVLGRHSELGGRLTLRQRISIDGTPILRHTVTLDPGQTGVGRHGHARVVVTAIEAGWRAVPAVSVVSPDLRCVRYPVGDTCAVWIALAGDLDQARAALADLGLDRRVPVLGGPRAVDETETST
ncbi:MAG: Urease accessory protein UreD, partial [Ilumatobacteraceae bacterium]|nr:Urease accessory protein UreD [Ilumatobacteraceae bacterium]